MPVKVEMPKKYLFALPILIALALSLASQIIVYADEPPIPHDYIQEVGEKYVFVMLSPYDPSAWAADIQDEMIRSKYSKSGLYTKGESPKLIWTVDWYDFQVEISSDGKYLVRWELLSSYSEYDAIAFTLFENGQEIKEYAINELVTFPTLLPNHFQWKEDSFFDKEQKLLWIRTLNGEEYTIDITTGDIVKGISPTVRITLFTLGVIVLTLAVTFIVGILFKPIKVQKRI